MKFNRRSIELRDTSDKSIFYLHTLEVLAVPFPALRDLYSYSYSGLDWRSSSDAGLNGLRRSPDQYFLFLFCAVRYFQSSKPVEIMAACGRTSWQSRGIYLVASLVVRVSSLCPVCCDAVCTLGSSVLP